MSPYPALRGRVLFADERGPREIGLDCLVDRGEGRPGTPVHLTGGLPSDSRFAVAAFAMIASWLADDRPVEVALDRRGQHPRLTVRCEDSRLVLQPGSTTGSR